MLLRLACVLFPLCFVSCDDEAGTTAPPNDLSMIVNNDLSAAADSCAAAAQCASMCTAANLISCGITCISKMSSTARPYFDAITGCVDKHCSTFVDGGTAKCDSDPSTMECRTCTATKCATEVAACQAH